MRMSSQFASYRWTVECHPVRAKRIIKVISETTESVLLWKWPNLIELSDEICDFGIFCGDCCGQRSSCAVAAIISTARENAFIGQRYHSIWTTQWSFLIQHSGEPCLRSSCSICELLCKLKVLECYVIDTFIRFRSIAPTAMFPKLPMCTTHNLQSTHNPQSTLSTHPSSPLIVASHWPLPATHCLLPATHYPLQAIHWALPESIHKIPLKSKIQLTMHQTTWLKEAMTATMKTPSQLSQFRMMFAVYWGDYCVVVDIKK